MKIIYLNKRLQEVGERELSKTLFTYDDRGNCLSITGLETDEVEPDFMCKFEYDNANRKISEIYISGEI